MASNSRLSEILVVATVFIVTTGLAVQAIRKAREDARRTQCTKSLKNIILALHNFEGVNQVLPGEAATKPGRFSLLLEIMPAIESNSIYSQINFEVAGPSIIQLTGNGPVTAANTRFGSNPEDRPQAGHHGVITTKFNVFNCPSDQGPDNTVGNSYCPVVTASGVTGAGTLDALWPATGGEGLAGPVAAGVPAWAANMIPRSIEKIPDGSSNMAAFVERVKGPRAGRSSNALNQGYRGSAPSAFTVTSGDVSSDNSAAIEGCRGTRNAGAPSTGNDTSGSYWFQYTCAFLGCANTMAAPNSAVCDDGIGRLDMADAGIAAASSYHGGGANFGMLDGSIRFLPDNIDLKVMHSLGTIGGGEKVARVPP